MTTAAHSTKPGRPDRTDPSPLRCSTAEREGTCSRLSEAAGEGRLTLTDTEDRIAKAYAADYRHELDALTADLPSSPPEPTGWGLVLSAVREQLALELALLLGRVPASAARRVRTLAAALVALLVLVAGVVLVLHGVLADGPEHVGGFTEREGPG